jgi:hypothetical protein
MKYSSKIAAALLAVSATGLAQANIIVPATGDSELLVVVTDAGTNNSFTYDTGILGSLFDSTAAQSFNLASLAPLWNTFKASATGQISFALMTSDASGSGTAAAGNRNALMTSAAGNVVTPVGNTAFQTITANIGSSYIQALNSITSDAAQQSTHQTDVNGASFTTLATGSTSFTNFFNTWMNTLGLRMTNIDGGQAEMYKASNTVGATGKVNLTNFYSSTETPSNLGGYWTLNSAGVLAYSAAPVPEASEWAMLLAGLGVVGLMVRRRSYSI